MNLEEKQKFFAHRPNTTTVRMGGKKLAVANLPKEVRNKVMDRLVEKDEVMRKGQSGILPGIKIDGKEITKDNIHEFEIHPVERIKEEKLEKMVEPEPTEEVEEVAEVEEPTKKGYSKEELQALSFKELKVIGNKLGTTDRSKKNIIKEILGLQ